MKKAIKITVLILCIYFPFLSCSKHKSHQDNRSGKKLMGVILTDNTSLRVDPYIFSSKIDMISKGETIEITDKSEVKSWIGNNNDYWYKVKKLNGVSGWIYGQNLKIIESSQAASDDYLEEFWEKEAGIIKKEISGKWWSLNEKGDFTDHCLEISGNGSYKSYSKNNPSSIIEGEYNFDFNKNEIIFLNGTSFKNNLTFIKRGSTYLFKTKINQETISFKKIIAK
ncbi:MAG TPA: SH3 domain-containing protein [Spirochaetota bacterium]|nr:SH3 domain-containing protein [Spirochaetota bacterium]HPI88087.1 SH3 domain-containing protein [Spirochaetota bacterium]HPR46428.1 SH3 domain-containing protein [Spirochaetota bacterium]